MSDFKRTSGPKCSAARGDHDGPVQLKLRCSSRDRSNDSKKQPAGAGEALLIFRVDKERKRTEKGKWKRLRDGLDINLAVLAHRPHLPCSSVSGSQHKIADDSAESISCPAGSLRTRLRVPNR